MQQVSGRAEEERKKRGKGGGVEGGYLRGNLSGPGLEHDVQR